MVTVMGYGNSLSTIFPMTLLLELTVYQRKHNISTLATSLECGLDIFAKENSFTRRPKSFRRHQLQSRFMLAATVT
jgi:hypothetical protein